MNELYVMQDMPCSCGKIHTVSVDEVLIEPGAINKIPTILKRFDANRVFVLADKNTYRVAGASVCRILAEAGIPHISYIFETDHLEPDEAAVGSAILHYDAACDFILGVGSGVINDIGKIVSRIAKVPYAIVATAPSMDGYASATSSMAVDGVKVSVNSRCPDVIIGDIDILKTAPDLMLQAGLGDMLAKYVGLCEWRIAHLILGEEYCENVANLVREALRKCVLHADGLLARTDEAISAVFEGLVQSGFAMTYAGTSRPASGGEHYISHIWDMRNLSFGTPVSLHGIQCGIGTLISARFYEKLPHITPDKARAQAYVQNFSYENYAAFLKKFLGKSAKAMIALEAKEGKYDKEKHTSRLERMLSHWDEIISIIETEMPKSREIAEILDKIGAPKAPEEIGIDSKDLPATIAATKDIRDKYVFSRLAWDLGILEEIEY